MCEVKKFKYFYNLYLNLSIFYFAIFIPMTLHGIAHAGSLYVSPVKIELSEKQKNEVINIKNDSDKEISIQIKTVKWSQYGDNENLESTKEILIAPKIFRLKPGVTQITRIGLLRNIDISKEMSYRILIEEIPSLTTDKFNGLNIVLSISIPVFIMPINPAKQNITVLPGFVCRIEEGR